MANQMLKQELDAILGAIAQSPEGVGIAELENAAVQYLGRPLIRRTLQRRLDLLMADKKIVGVGKSVARVYRLNSEDATAYVQGVAAVAAAGAIHAEIYVPMSAEGAEIRHLVRQALMHRRPVGYQREFLEAYKPGVTWYLPESTRLQLHEITNEPFEIMGVVFTPIDVLHHRLPVFGFRIGNFAYITDVNHISESEQAKLKNLDVLVIGALQREQHISHYTLEEAIKMADNLRPKVTYFTHLSHKMGRHTDVEKELPPHIKIGYDGLRLKLDA